MEKKQIILPKLRYEGAPEVDSQIRIGFDEDKTLLKIDDRDIVIDLAEQFAAERAASLRYKLYGKMKMVFRNLYAGASPYEYLKERLALISDGSDGNFCGFLPYNEFAFLRDDIYYETIESPSLDVLSGFTQFNLISSGSTEHQAITALMAPQFNWNIYLTYIHSHDIDFPMKYTLSGGTIPTLSFVSGDGIPFRVEETINMYVLTSPVKHGMSQGEYVVINGNYYYINSVGNEIYRSEEYVINILKSQTGNVTLSPLVTGKRCTDIKDIDNCTSEYYVHKHRTVTDVDKYVLDKVGFESPIWEDEQKLLFENSAGDNDVLVVRNRMEAVFFDFKEPFVLSGITNNLGYTPTELYITIIFRNGDGYFNYPPKVGYSFHMHDTWIDEHFDGDTALETGITGTYFTRPTFPYPFYSGNTLPRGTELYGAFVEYNLKEMKERVISEAFHKIVSNPLIFNHAQTSSSTYSGATETNPVGILYQPHYRYKIRELSPYIESSDISTPVENLPENALYFPAERVWRWRDLYDDGYIDPDGYGTDYPYLNNMHYIHKNINFYLRNEQIYTNKKDAVINFYKTPELEPCDVLSTAYMRGGHAPSPIPAVSPSPFVPSPTPCPSSSAPIIMGAYYVATNGSDSNPGTLEQPWATWDFAFNQLIGGSTLYIRGGVYYPTGQYGVRVNYRSGTAHNLIRVLPYPYDTEKPILDCINVTDPGNHVGINMNYCNYWHIKGLTVRNVLEYQSGGVYQYVAGWNGEMSNMIFEECVVYDSGSGFAVGSGSDIVYFINCDAYQNADHVDAGGYANGFSATPSAGGHIYYQGCRAWLNSDDGFDFYGGNGYISLNNCWAFENGSWDGEIGDGAGFKTGASYGPKENGVQRTLTNCLSFNNLGYGFDESQDAYTSIEHNIYNCSSYHNLVGFNFHLGGGAIDVIRNNVSYDETLNNSGWGPNIVDHNSWQIATVSAADFLELNSSGVKGERINGQLPLLNFLHLANGSDLIWVGTDVGLTNDALGYSWHIPPSLGPYESFAVVPSPSAPSPSVPSPSVPSPSVPGPSPSRTPMPTPSRSRTPAPSQTPLPVLTGDIYLSPTGNDDTGDGTYAHPWFTLNRAWESVIPGNIIYLRGGNYRYQETQFLDGKSGAPGDLIKIYAYPNETPNLTRDSSFTTRGYSTLIYLNGDYTHWKGIEISYFPQPITGGNYMGLIMQRASHNIFELINYHHCGFPFTIGDGPEDTSTDNLILNSDFHHNYDPYTPYDPYGNADGFAIIAAAGTYNTMRGCRMWSNSDDGWDSYANDGSILIDNCWAWSNGYKEDGVTAGGNGHGFKLGESTHDYSSTHLYTVQNSLAFHNRQGGFSQANGRFITWLFNNTAYHNADGAGVYNLGFEFADSGTRVHILRNNIAFANQNPINLQANYNNCIEDHNSWDSPFIATTADFMSVDMTGVDGPRNADGSKPSLNFLKLAPTSDLIWGGVSVGLPTDGVGNLWHNPPSLGAFEAVPVPASPSPTPTVTRTPSQSMSIAGFYYVSDATGIDSIGRNGSISQPWATLSYAISRVTIGGSTIYMMAGNYSESGQMNLPSSINIMGAGRNVVTVTMTYSASYPCIKLETSNGWGNPNYGNQSISGIKFDGNLAGSRAIGVNFRSNVRVYDCEFVDFIDGAVFFDGQPYYEWTLDNPYNNNPSSDYPLMPDPNGWCTGNRFYNNIVTNCARYVSADHHTGSLSIGAQDGFIAYGNNIDATSRHGYGIKFWDLGFNKNSDIHDNTIETYPLINGVHFEFTIEWWWSFGGDRFYNNRLNGSLDLVNCVDHIGAGYSVRIYDNNIGRDATPISLERGILLEGKIEYVQIYRNHIHHVARAVYVPRNNYTGNDRLFHVDVYDNLMVNLGQTGSAWQTWGFAWTDPVSDEGTTEYFRMQNNVIHALPLSTLGVVTAYGIMLPRVNRMNHIYVDNNIILNFNGGAVYGSETRALASNVIIRNNTFFGNGASNGLNFDANFTNTLNASGGYIYSGTLTSDPQFVAIGSNFHLAPTSPAIHTGIYIGLVSDFSQITWGNPPSRGAYEYTLVPQSPSRTPSRTPSMSIPRTPSLSPTPTRTPSITRTPDITPSRTPSRSISRTPTRTPSRTPSILPPSGNITTITANHTIARYNNLLTISPTYLQSAKDHLLIAYEHTSHGEQIGQGMTGLISSPMGGSNYNWVNSASHSAGYLSIHDHGIHGWWDLGYADQDGQFDVLTRTYLSTHPNCNVVMWSWCGELSYWTSTRLQTYYLNLMAQLEIDYQNVTFVYMTGHLDGTGTSGNLHLRNEEIRAHCATNNRVLFDFADIERYNPDNVDYLALGADDGCNYSGGNWATAWQGSHVLDTDWYNCSASHSQPLNANMKAYAAWWMFARIAQREGY